VRQDIDSNKYPSYNVELLFSGDEINCVLGEDDEIDKCYCNAQIK
jgi:hypothetical protein